MYLGNSPDFHQSMNASSSKDFFDKFVEKLRISYKPELIKGFTNEVQTRNIRDYLFTVFLVTVGKFGHYMEVELKNDGPVTIQLESPKT